MRSSQGYCPILQKALNLFNTAFFMNTSVVKLIHYDKTKSEENMEELHSADIPAVYQEDVIREDNLKEKK